MVSTKFVVLTLILAGCVFVQCVDKCYVCYSHEDAECKDESLGLGAVHKVECDYNNDSKAVEGGCSKEKAVGKYLGIKFEATNRTCGISYDNVICKNSYPFEYPWLGITDAKAWQCTCVGDYCNSSEQITPALSLMSLLAFSLLLRKML